LASYIAEVANEHDRQQAREARRREQSRLQHDTQERMAKQMAERKQFEAQWKPQWDRLPKAEQHVIRSRLVAKSPWLKRIPSLWEYECLRYIAKRSGHDAAA